MFFIQMFFFFLYFADIQKWSGIQWCTIKPYWKLWQRNCQQIFRFSSKLTSIRTKAQKGSSIALIQMEDGTTIRAKVTTTNLSVQLSNTLCKYYSRKKQKRKKKKSNIVPSTMNKIFFFFFLIFIFDSWDGKRGFEAQTFLLETSKHTN